MLLALLIAGKLLMKPGGDRPNKEEKITGKQHFWRDKKVKNGYRLDFGQGQYKKSHRKYECYGG